MLNGKRISVIIAEGGSDEDEPEAVDAEPAPAPEPERAEHAKMETPVEPFVQPETHIMSVSEYEARQLQMAK